MERKPLKPKKCSACHDRLDARTSSAPAVTGADMLRALAETQLKWLDMGLMTIKGMK